MDFPTVSPYGSFEKPGFAPLPQIQADHGRGPVAASHDQESLGFNKKYTFNGLVWGKNETGNPHISWENPWFPVETNHRFILILN